MESCVRIINHFKCVHKLDRENVFVLGKLRAYLRYPSFASRNNIFRYRNTMRPALHVVWFKYSNRFHPSVERIHLGTERGFPTVQINASLIYSTIPSSNRGIRQVKIILKFIHSGSEYDYALAALWDTVIKFSFQSRAMTSSDHLDSFFDSFNVA